MVLLKFRKSIFSLFYSFLQAAVICGAFSFVFSFLTGSSSGILIFMSSLIFLMLCICISWHFKITEVKGNILEIRSGFLFRQKKCFSMEYIQEVNVRQSIIGKYLKYGDLIITAPTIDQSIVIKSLDNVTRLGKVLNDYARDQENEGFMITSG